MAGTGLTFPAFSAHASHFNSVSSAPWIIDIGATDHMVHSLTLLTTVTSSVSSFVKLPNASSVPVTHIGTCTPLLSYYFNQCPCGSFNLISVSSLLKQMTCCLIPRHHHLFIQDLHTWITIGLAKKHGYLLILLDSRYCWCFS